MPISVINLLQLINYFLKFNRLLKQFQVGDILANFRIIYAKCVYNIPIAVDLLTTTISVVFPTHHGLNGFIQFLLLLVKVCTYIHVFEEV